MTAASGSRIAQAAAPASLWPSGRRILQHGSHGFWRMVELVAVTLRLAKTRRSTWVHPLRPEQPALGPAVRKYILAERGAMASSAEPRRRAFAGRHRQSRAPDRAPD